MFDLLLQLLANVFRCTVDELAGTKDAQDVSVERNDNEAEATGVVWMRIVAARGYADDRRIAEVQWRRRMALITRISNFFVVIGIEGCWRLCFYLRK